MSSEPNAQGLAQAGKYLTFALAGEEYGIGILKVKEIIGLLPITPIPRTPPQIRGVINLRGKVIPVVELRLKFGLEPAEADERTCIIVVEMQHDGHVVQMGIIVDSVSEVANIAQDSIEAPPSLGMSSVDTEFITGMAKSQDKVRILMDIDKVLTDGELAAMAA